MPLNYYECFGVPISSPEIGPAFRSKLCPFVEGPCTKSFSLGINGACSLVNPTNEIPVPCCPKRLYGDCYRVLQDVVRTAWGDGIPLIPRGTRIPDNSSFVTPFGQKQGHEIRISYKESKGASKFSLDWILAKVDENKNLEGFVAVEVQTVDTTGNYQQAFWDLANEYDADVINGVPRPQKSSANFNFENVNKRILSQLITKGHILRREPLCNKGLFFICPSAVHERMMTRVGPLEDYPIQSGSVTFLSYSIKKDSNLVPRPLILDKVTTTTTDQLYLALSSPKQLPPQGVYENAIRKALQKRFEAV
jgi:hypothetical protein